MILPPMMSSRVLCLPAPSAAILSARPPGLLLALQRFSTCDSEPRRLLRGAAPCLRCSAEAPELFYEHASAQEIEFTMPLPYAQATTGRSLSDLRRAPRYAARTVSPSCCEMPRARRGMPTGYAIVFDSDALSSYDDHASISACFIAADIVAHMRYDAFIIFYSPCPSLLSPTFMMLLCYICRCGHSSRHDIDIW